MKYFVYKLYSFLILKIRKSKLIFYLLFGYYPQDQAYGNYWDWTTLELKKVLKEMKNSKLSILDVGTGPYGVLAYYAHIKLAHKNVTGIDHCGELILNAEKQNTNIAIPFVTSDLFSHISKKYDLILFNAPYIDNIKGKAMGAWNNDFDEKRWSGGQDGVQTVARFLNELSIHLNKGGLGLLGVNLFHIKPQVIHKAIQDANLRIDKISKNHFTKGCVFIVSVKN